jgi:DNA (cytosine-5)-methyltransferase 1
MGSITRDADSQSEGGYGHELRIVDAADYGVPQKRHRTIGHFVYRISDDEVEFPEPTHAEDPDDTRSRG